MCSASVRISVTILLVDLVYGFGLGTLNIILNWNRQNKIFGKSYGIMFHCELVFSDSMNSLWIPKCSAKFEVSNGMNNFRLARISIISF